MNKINLLMIIVIGLFLTGCATSRDRGNDGNMQSFEFSTTEPAWIVNGEPLQYDGELWYPKDGIETLMDSEVYLLGEYQGTQFFADRIDVKPYERIYTKFARNKFRYFEKRNE